MAVFKSYVGFDINAVNLHWYWDNYYDDGLEDNVNIYINGKTYQDLYWVNGYDGYNDHELQFGGYNITTDAFGNILSGTVTLVAEGDYNTRAMFWYLEGISLSAVAIDDAALTPSNADEMYLIQTALSGNDIIALSPYDDRMSGFAGDDVISGGLGRDILSGGSGNDTFFDTAAGLDGDTITDFSAGDSIVIDDANPANFAFSLSGSTLTFTGGSLTFGSALTGTLLATAAANGGVRLVLGTTPAINDVRNDFNGDGRSDVLWRHDSGLVTSWSGQSNGSFAAGFSAQVDNSWHVAGTGDFNGDGRDDIVWHNDGGAFAEWLGQTNGSFTGGLSTQVDPSWNVTGTGDFNGDGRDDILWRHEDGTLVGWVGQVDGYAIGGSTHLDTSWHVAGTGDFNGDGRDDIVWRHDSGYLAQWLGQADGNFASGINTQVDSSWNVTGTGDFNGDGRDDILWRHDSGYLTEWLGQAGGSFASGFSTQIDSSWGVANTGDFNGDGRDDILWRHDSGYLTEWLGQAGGSFASGFSTQIDNSWHVQSSEYFLV